MAVASCVDTIAPPHRDPHDAHWHCLYRDGGGAPQTPQKHVWRCQIILATDDGLGTNAIQAHAGSSKSTVWRWQQRFMAERVKGLLYDKTRPPGKAPTPEAKVQAVLTQTQAAPPPGATHWTVRALAREMDLHPSVVHMIWRRHGLAPHRCRQFKVSTDPHFARKARDVIGLYVAPPDHVLVLSVDEKTQIQALSRTQAGLPMRAGQPATQTHDYQRHGTTTLFEALDVQTGQVASQMCPPPSRCMSSWTTTAPTRPLAYRTGWRPIPTGRFISRPPPAPG